MICLNVDKLPLGATGRGPPFQGSMLLTLKKRMMN